ncbi:hypothetical protein JCM5350_004817 [Sporobolomyces pararoseus]
MGLVDYGSDSDSDSSPPPPVVPSVKTQTTSSSTSSFLDLPAPKSSLNLPKPTRSTSTSTSTTSKPSLPLPKKKDKNVGPVRIVLDDLPSSTAAETDEGGPAKKKAKLTLGGGGGLSGLAAMLPKPKNQSQINLPPPSTSKPVQTTTSRNTGLGDMFGIDSNNGAEKKQQEEGTMFAPNSIRTKGKGKASIVAPPPVEEVEEEEPAVDFFGISSVTSSAPSAASSSSSSSKPASSSLSAPSISSAPSIRDPSSTKKIEPTSSDPYPGFTQLPSGEWVAKDQKTYELALQWQQQQQQQQQEAQQAELPKGFEEKEIRDKGGYKDINELERAREAWATRPSQLPGKEEEFKKSTQIKGIPKQASQQARRKGQLSSLIAEAHDNRAELEERIAQARLNRKSAGNKYGF